MRAQLLFLLTVALWIQATACLAAETAPTPSDLPTGANAVDVTLPLTELPAMQWIVVTNGDSLQIMPATSRGTPDGVVVSAHAAGVTPDTLRAAVVRTREGGTVTSPLKPGS